MDLAALITHLDQKEEALSLETLHQFPHLLKKTFVSCLAIQAVGSAGSELIKIGMALDHDGVRPIPVIVKEEPELALTLNIKSKDVRVRLTRLLKNNPEALSGTSSHHFFFVEKTSEFYSWEFQEEFIDYFRNHSFKDFIQIKQVDVNKHLLKLFHPQVAQTMKA